MTEPIRPITAAEEVVAAARQVRECQERFVDMPTDRLLDVLDDFGNRLGSAGLNARVEGLTFLSFWLRRRNLERLLDLNFGGERRAALDRFIPAGGGMLRAQPAGLVAHWVAGNVPTLAIFSWALSALVKNVAVVRVSQQTIPQTAALIEVLASARAGGLSGADLLEGVRFAHFPRDAVACHKALSEEADCKVIWGSSEAVRSVTALPRQEHCTEVVFGPKYSLGVIDRATTGPALAETAKAFVRDMIIFDQRACSSPQTIFVERGAAGPEELVDLFAEQFRKASQGQPKTEIDTYTATRIYNTRALWGLHPERTVRLSEGADWTVCHDLDLELKDAVQSRTVFLTTVEDLMQVVPLLGPKIQTVGCAVADADKALRFAEAATRRGVSRCVKPGLMNVYDLPWDGKLVLNELVRWVSARF